VCGWVCGGEGRTEMEQQLNVLRVDLVQVDNSQSKVKVSKQEERERVREREG